MALDPYRPPDAPPSDLHALATVPNLAHRWFAVLIDGVLVVIPGITAMFAVGALGVAISARDEQAPGLASALYGVVQLGILALQLAYGTLFEASSWQATPGKRLMGMRVVTPEGGRLTLSAALGRNLVKSLGLAACSLLAFTVLTDSQQRGVWDRVAGTRVVPAPPNSLSKASLSS